VREVVGLRPGQVVKLSTRADGPIPVKVGERVKFSAKPGLRARAIVIQIEEVLKNS
jgi:flagellar motor switch protein FliM